jgi:hypothetical protein
VLGVEGERFPVALLCLLGSVLPREVVGQVVVQIRFLGAELDHAAEEGFGASGFAARLGFGSAPLITDERDRFFEDPGHDRIIECHVGGEDAGKLGSGESFFPVAGTRLGARQSRLDGAGVALDRSSPFEVGEALGQVPSLELEAPEAQLGDGASGIDGQRLPVGGHGVLGASRLLVELGLENEKRRIAALDRERGSRGFEGRVEILEDLQALRLEVRPAEVALSEGSRDGVALLSFAVQLVGLKHHAQPSPALSRAGIVLHRLPGLLDSRRHLRFHGGGVGIWDSWSFPVEDGEPDDRRYNGEGESSDPARSSGVLSSALSLRHGDDPTPGAFIFESRSLSIE